MTDDYAMTTLNRIMATPAERRPHAAPIDPAIRATVARLVGELNAMGLRGTARP